jgi:hypothetical protein
MCELNHNSDAEGMTQRYIDMREFPLCPAKHSKLNELFWVSGENVWSKKCILSLGM